MRIGWRMSVIGTVSAIAILLVASSASGLVAPVSAGPPQRPTLKHLDLNGFFPTSTRIHVGDSVSWSINGFHTVSFLAAGQTPSPPFIPSSANPISGRLDAANAPFWFNG